MNPLIELKTATPVFLIVLVLACFALSPTVQADPNSNTSYGRAALPGDTVGDRNSAFGVEALSVNSTGSQNTALGNAALESNMTGAFNTAIGEGALVASTGSGNTALGRNAGGLVRTASNVICIGLNIVGANVSNSCFIGNIFGATSSGGTAVFVNSEGKLGTTSSSKRFTEDIKPMDKASEALLALKPVTFRYKKELVPAAASQFGLVAEDVEKVNPDLVVPDKEGKPHSVRYEAVNAMLLNEFLKEHRTVQELESNAVKRKRLSRASKSKLKRLLLACRR